MNRVLIEGAGRTVRADFEGRPTAAEVVFDAGFALDTACGGRGICGRCRLALGPGRYETLAGRAFEVADGEEREMLGCRVRLVGPSARLRVPDSSLIEQRAQIHEDYVLPEGERRPRVRRVAVRPVPPTLENPGDAYERLTAALRGAAVADGLSCPLEILRRLPGALEDGGGTVTVTLGPAETGDAIVDIEPGDTTASPLPVVAADIGTTTVVCVLLDARDGRALARVSRYNQQIRKADDVASRISFCDGPEEVDLMRRLVVEETLNPLIHEACVRAGLAPSRVLRLAVAGNTTMMHLLAGVSPQSIGRAPFQAAALRWPPLPAHAIGLDVGQAARLDIVPSISAYVGGDIVADLYAARLTEGEGPALLVDIGTNGEMALWDGGRLRVTATAAGPAFEGAGVRYGCRAAAGAIERFRWNDDLSAEIKVIGPHAPVGLCGSALIDFLADSFRIGLLDEVGRFDLERLRAAGRYVAAPGPKGGTQHACRIVSGDESGIEGPIYVTEGDVAELLKAKAAVYAGLRTLLSVGGRRPCDLRELVLAGGFARHLNVENAQRIGLLPPIPPGRIRVIGNGALAGAVLLLTDPRAPSGFEQIRALAETVELNLVTEFAGRYADALLLPNGDPGEFER